MSQEMDASTRGRPRVAVVSGAASGIGAAAAEAFAAAGCRVVIADRDEEAAESHAETLRARGYATRAAHVDVTDAVSVAGLFAGVKTEYHGCDVLINSAGISGTTDFEEVTLESWNRMLSINVTGTLLMAQGAVELMKQSGSGRIVNISSVNGLRATRGRTVYGTSKAAVIGLTRQMAIELAAYRITVNAVAPGPIDTPMTRAFYTPTVREAWNRQIPLARFGTTEEVAAACRFLASPEASYVTGHTLPVDGGFTAAGLLEV